MKKICMLIALSSSLMHPFMKFNSQERYFNLGLRVGAATFYGQAHSTQTQTAAGTTTNAITYNSTTFNGAPSFQGGIFGELSYRCGCWAYGTLFDVNGDTMKKDYGTVSTVKITAPAYNDLRTYTIKSPLHIGIDARGGYLTEHALWYGLIGVEGIKYYYSHALNVQSGIFSSTNPAVVTFCREFWRAGLRVGTGIEYNISECLNLKLEYRFIWAGKKTITGTDATVTIDNTGTLNVVDCISLRQQVTSLMLSYIF
jgi:opacity protein-like surface antigen